MCKYCYVPTWYFIVSASLSINRVEREDSWYVSRLDRRSVCRSVRKVYCGKTAEWIRVPFGVVSGVSRGMGVLEGVDVPQEEGWFRKVFVSIILGT